MNARARDLLWLAGLCVLLLAAPFVVPNEYWLAVLTIGCLNAMIAVGLNLLVGHAGQISLGHAAFFGLSAYATAILTTTLHLPIPLGLAAGVGLSVLVALVIGIPALKLRGHYLAMATLGFGVIVSILLNETVWLTGGPSGFTGIPRLVLLGFDLSSARSFAILAACVLCLLVLMALNLLHSRIGRALRAIHTSERAAQAVGIDIAAYKLFVFVLSAAFAGVAGVLYAHYLTFVAPSSFGFVFSVELIVMVVLGGMASIPGSIAGAFFLTILPEFLRAFENIEVLLFGAILVVCMIFLPGGLAGGCGRLYRFLARRFSRKEAADA